MTDADQNTIDAQVPKLARFAWALLISLPIPAFAAEQIWIEPNPRAANQSDWYPKPIESIVADVVRFNATDLIVVRAGDDTESSAKGCDQPPPIKGPGGIAVDHQQRRPVALVYVMHARIAERHVMGFEWAKRTPGVFGSHRASILEQY